MTQINALFPTATDAQSARNRLMASGVPDGDMSLQVAPPALVEETAGEARQMGRIVVIIVLASVVGTGIGVGMGALLHVLIGPEGTSGLIIQVVSWAIFAHLLIGLWAGYFLLADRTEREIGRARPVILVIQCANIDRDTVRESLRGLGGVEIETPDLSKSRSS